MFSNTKYSGQHTWKGLKPSPQQSATTPKGGSDKHNTTITPAYNTVPRYLQKQLPHYTAVAHPLECPGPKICSQGKVLTGSNK